MSVVIAVGRSAFGTVRRERKLLSKRSPIIRRLKLTVARPRVYAARNEPEWRGRRRSGWPGWNCWLVLWFVTTSVSTNAYVPGGRQSGDRPLHRQLQLHATRLRAVDVDVLGNAVSRRSETIGDLIGEVVPKEVAVARSL